MSSYFEYQNKNTTYRCRSCEWTGGGEACEQGEMFRDLFEIHCPSCHTRVGVVTFPMMEELRAHCDELSQDDQQWVRALAFHQQQFEAMRLRSPEDLPNIEANTLTLRWDTDDYQLPRFVMIKHGRCILWKEPAIYEGSQRFMEVGDILKRKYGKRLKDLVPTPKSLLYLYGDDLSSPQQLAKYQETFGR